MYILEIDSKKGFKCLSPLTIERKHKSGLFSQFLECKKDEKFNLPFGVYRIYGAFEQLEKPLIYSYKIYKPERKIKVKQRVKSVYINNPHKASIVLNKGLMLLDEKLFAELNNYERAFIMLHELGHYFYETEFKCDTFAGACMLKIGYNPKQVIEASKSLLKCSLRNKKTVQNFKQ